MRGCPTGRIFTAVYFRVKNDDSDQFCTICGWLLLATNNWRVVELYITLLATVVSVVKLPTVYSSQFTM